MKRSALYECEVVHQRLAPKKHHFRYRLFFLDLDLSEIPNLEKQLWLFSHNKFNLFEFRDKDHLDLGQLGLRANLEAHLKEKGITLPENATIRLITLPRVMGYIFNPVCFYFFFDKAGHPIHALAEVTNTFREMKLYLIDQPDSNDCFRLTTPKEFYISPFTALDTKFKFKLHVPNKKIEIHIDDIEGEKTILLSWIRGKRQELTNRRLAICALKYPLLTLQVISKIHWQAIRLWMKKLPFHRKSESPELQTEVLNPHRFKTNTTKP